MAASVYLETTIISYLTGRQSRNVIVAAHQQLAREWWHHQRLRFQCYVSELVVQEAAVGDPVAATRRLAALEGITILQPDERAQALARELIQSKAVPARARNDAAHVAIAAAHGTDYLLTWNCRHLANVEMHAKISRCCRDFGLESPIVCTPEVLMGMP